MMDTRSPEEAGQSCCDGGSTAITGAATAEAVPGGHVVASINGRGMATAQLVGGADAAPVQNVSATGARATVRSARRQVVLVMPEFNEERTLVTVLREAAPHVDRIVVVDDGSHDASYAQTMQWMRSSGLQVDLLRHARNRGMSGALLSGFAHVYFLAANGQLGPDDVVVNIDADGQHDPAEIPGMVARLVETGVDVVLGRRDLSGYPRYKRLGNWGLSLAGSLLAGYRYRDIECGFRAVRVRTVAALLQYFRGHRYGCAQELGVILPRCGFSVDNSLAVHVRYYREGARFRDGAVNASMGLLAFLRVTMRARDRLERRVPALLSELSSSSRVAG